MKLDKLVVMHSNEARVATNLLYLGFGYKDHRSFKKIIWNNLDRFKEIGEVLQSSTVDGSRLKKMGQPDKSYILNSRQFTLLIMLAKNSPESIELKCRVEKEFDRMRKTLARIFTRNSNIEWREARKETKISTLDKNDTVKKFVEYATEQGSRSASMYYMLFAKSENSALFFMEKGLKNLREIANIKQLNKIKAADLIIENIIEVEMEKNTFYKNIYKICDQKLKDFSEMVGKSHILMLQESQELKKLNISQVLQ